MTRIYAPLIAGGSSYIYFFLFLSPPFRLLLIRPKGLLVEQQNHLFFRLLNAESICKQNLPPVTRLAGRLIDRARARLLPMLEAPCNSSSSRHLHPASGAGMPSAPTRRSDLSARPRRKTAVASREMHSATVVCRLRQQSGTPSEKLRHSPALSCFTCAEVALRCIAVSSVESAECAACSLAVCRSRAPLRAPFSKTRSDLIL